MPLIHPTAIIDPKAEIDSSVEIGPFSVVEGNVRIGAGCKISSCCRLCGDLVLGENNKLYHGVCLGEWPQHMAYDPASMTGVRIGNNNEFREGVTVHRAFVPEHNTTIGNNCYLMCMAHVGHDSILHDSVILVNGVLLGGHAEIFEHATLSGYVMVHQFTRVGAYCMISGACKVCMDVPPYCMATDNCSIEGLNSVGLRRNDFDGATRKTIKDIYKLYFETFMSKEEFMQEVEKQYGTLPVAQEILSFFKTSQRGVTRKLGREKRD